MKSRREAELKERRALYEWGKDEVYEDLPGYVKASGVKNLPKDVQFTEEAAYDLHRARKNALINLGLVHLLNFFDQWDDFDDYCKVCRLTLPIFRDTFFRFCSVVSSEMVRSILSDYCRMIIKCQVISY